MRPGFAGFFSPTTSVGNSHSRGWKCYSHTAPTVTLKKKMFEHGIWEPLDRTGSPGAMGQSWDKVTVIQGDRMLNGLIATAYVFQWNLSHKWVKCVLGTEPGKCLQDRIVWGGFSVDMQLWWDLFVHSCPFACIKENSNEQRSVRLVVRMAVPHKPYGSLTDQRCHGKWWGITSLSKSLSFY